GDEPATRPRDRDGVPDGRPAPPGDRLAAGQGDRHPGRRRQPVRFAVGLRTSAGENRLTPLLRAHRRACRDAGRKLRGAMPLRPLPAALAGLALLGLAAADAAPRGVATAAATATPGPSDWRTPDPQNLL